MRADCDPETRKRISRLRLNRLSSGLALGGLVISFPPSFFPSNTFAVRKNRWQITISCCEYVQTRAAPILGRLRSETVRAIPLFYVTALDTAYLCTDTLTRVNLCAILFYLFGTRNSKCRYDTHAPPMLSTDGDTILYSVIPVLNGSYSLADTENSQWALSLSFTPSFSRSLPRIILKVQRAVLFTATSKSLSDRKAREMPSRSALLRATRKFLARQRKEKAKTRRDAKLRRSRNSTESSPI